MTSRAKRACAVAGPPPIDANLDSLEDSDPADGALSPHRIEPATVLVDIKAWPGNVSVFGKVGATASLDINCACRLSRAGRGEETGSAAEQRN